MPPRNGSGSRSDRRATATIGTISTMKAIRQLNSDARMPAAIGPNTAPSCGAFWWTENTAGRSSGR